MAVIGIMDSGIGGLSVLFELNRIKAGNKLIYLADNARCPYGNMSYLQLENAVMESCEYLLSKGVELIVIACNTATSVIERVRYKYNVPIVGTEPAVMPAIRAGHKNIQVLATPSTLNSAKYRLLIHNYTDIITNTPLPDLASEIEAVAPNFDSLIPKIKQIILQETDAIVLGCTHYVFIRSLFVRAFPHLKVYDSGQAIANHTFSLLPNYVQNKPNTFQFHFTSCDESNRYLALFRHIHC